MSNGKTSQKINKVYQKFKKKIHDRHCKFIPQLNLIESRI